MFGRRIEERKALRPRVIISRKEVKGNQRSEEGQKRRKKKGRKVELIWRALEVMKRRT